MPITTAAKLRTDLKLVTANETTLGFEYKVNANEKVRAITIAYNLTGDSTEYIFTIPEQDKPVDGKFNWNLSYIQEEDIIGPTLLSYDFRVEMAIETFSPAGVRLDSRDDEFVEFKNISCVESPRDPLIFTQKSEILGGQGVFPISLDNHGVPQPLRNPKLKSDNTADTDDGFLIGETTTENPHYTNQQDDKNLWFGLNLYNNPEAGNDLSRVSTLDVRITAFATANNHKHGFTDASNNDITDRSFYTYQIEESEKGKGFKQGFSWYGIPRTFKAMYDTGLKDIKLKTNYTYSLRVTYYVDSSADNSAIAYTRTFRTRQVKAIINTIPPPVSNNVVKQGKDNCAACTFNAPTSCVNAYFVMFSNDKNARYGTPGSDAESHKDQPGTLYFGPFDNEGKLVTKAKKFTNSTPGALTKIVFTAKQLRDTVAPQYVIIQTAIIEGARLVLNNDATNRAIAAEESYAHLDFKNLDYQLGEPDAEVNSAQLREKSAKIIDVRENLAEDKIIVTFTLPENYGYTAGDNKGLLLTMVDGNNGKMVKGAAQDNLQPNQKTLFVNQIAPIIPIGSVVDIKHEPIKPEMHYNEATGEDEMVVLEREYIADLDEEVVVYKYSTDTVYTATFDEIDKFHALVKAYNGIKTANLDVDSVGLTFIDGYADEFVDGVIPDVTEVQDFHGLPFHFSETSVKTFTPEEGPLFLGVNPKLNSVKYSDTHYVTGEEIVDLLVNITPGTIDVDLTTFKIKIAAINDTTVTPEYLLPLKSSFKSGTTIRANTGSKDEPISFSLTDIQKFAMDNHHTLHSDGTTKILLDIVVQDKQNHRSTQLTHEYLYQELPKISGDSLNLTPHYYNWNNRDVTHPSVDFNWTVQENLSEYVIDLSEYSITYTNHPTTTTHLDSVSSAIQNVDADMKEGGSINVPLIDTNNKQLPNTLTCSISSAFRIKNLNNPHEEAFSLKSKTYVTSKEIVFLTKPVFGKLIHPSSHAENPTTTMTLTRPACIKEVANLTINIAGKDVEVIYNESEDFLHVENADPINIKLALTPADAHDKVANTVYVDNLHWGQILLVKVKFNSNDVLNLHSDYSDVYSTIIQKGIAYNSSESIFTTEDQGTHVDKTQHQKLVYHITNNGSYIDSFTLISIMGTAIDNDTTTNKYNDYPIIFVKLNRSTHQDGLIYNTMDNSKHGSYTITNGDKNALPDYIQELTVLYETEGEGITKTTVTVTYKSNVLDSQNESIQEGVYGWFMMLDTIGQHGDKGFKHFNDSLFSNLKKPTPSE